MIRTKVQTVIAAAGRNSQLPAKISPLTTIQGRTVLDLAISSYATNPSMTSVCFDADPPTASAFSNHLVDSGFEGRQVRVPASTEGALATVLLGLDPALMDYPVVVASGNSLVRGGILHDVETWISAGVSAATQVFESTDDRYSYVRLDGDCVDLVAEKLVVSSWATTGVFYFSNAQLLLEAAEWCFVNNIRTSGIFYTSAALNYLVYKGFQVRVSKIPAERYAMLATQTDIERYRRDS